MAEDMGDKAAVEARLWDELKGHPTGMLGLVGGAAQHFQPMTATVERDEGALWFFSYRDAEIVEAALGGHEAMFVLQRDGDLYACVEGELTIRPEPERIDRYWNSAIAAWYPQGKDDPRLTLLCFEARDAAVWIRDAGPIRIAVEMAKARFGDRTPNVSERTSLKLGDRGPPLPRSGVGVPGSFAP